MSENNKVGEKTVDELIAEIRAQLISLRDVPISGIVAAGKYIEWKLRELEQAVRAIEAKYDYARHAATALYKRGGAMRARQLEYFKDRTCVKLQASKEAEAAFDAVLGEVARHDKPQQATLALGRKEA